MIHCGLVTVCQFLETVQTVKLFPAEGVTDGTMVFPLSDIGCLLGSGFTAAF